MCPRSGFRSGGTCERTLVPVFIPGEHPNVPSFRLVFRGNIRQNHPFGKPPFCQPPKILLTPEDSSEDILIPPPKKRTGKNNKLNFLWPKMFRLGPPFCPPKSPRKSLCGSPFCVLSQEMRHINFFLGAQHKGFRAGAKKFMLKKFICLFCPLTKGTQNVDI